MRGFTDLFVDSWREYKAKFTSILQVFLLLYALPVIVFGGIAFFVIVSYFGVSSDFNNSLVTEDIVLQLFEDTPEYFVVSMLIFLFAFGLIFFGFYSLMTLSFIYIGFSKKNKINFKGSIGGGWKFFWSYIGLSLLLLLALSGLFLLLIIPGVIFLVYWTFAPYVLFNEKKGIIDSMKGSFHLVKGRWWKTFGFVFKMILFTILVSLIFSYIPFGDFISTLLLTPFAIFFFKNLYLDMKKG